MKVSEAIAQANDLRDNTLTDAQKAAWLYNLDGEVSEIVGQDAPVNSWPETDAELLMPAPQTDPIPWTSGMTAHKGLYYTEDGKTYLCIREDAATGTELYYKISDLLGNYFEAVTA